jgi:hypothetical protein
VQGANDQQRAAIGISLCATVARTLSNSARNSKSEKELAEKIRVRELLDDMRSATKTSSRPRDETRTRRGED